MGEQCTWCGAGVEPDDGFRAYAQTAATNTAAASGDRRAVFCRLEHLVPWALQGAHWDPGPFTEPAALDEGPLRCSHCDAELGDVHILLIRHRGEHRVADAFCSVEHLEAWAKAGGRWR